MSGGRIGELGTVREALQLDFGYFGLVVRVHPEAGELSMIEFMEAAADLDEHDEVRGVRAIGDYLRSLIHPDDWDAFWRASKANRQNLADLMATSHAIVEAIAGFPTGQSSGSSAGRRNTRRKSKGVSSSPDTGRALQLLRGRPDLQAAVVRRHEALEASAG